MKQFLLLVAAAVAGLTSTAQVDVELDINHMVDGQSFAFNTAYSAPNGYSFKATRLEYYISEIELVHDGGTVTAIDSMWLLVDASQTSNYSLGSQNITNLEGINFWVGVDAAHNHLDPAQWPATHALAPQNPSMHWGWTSGYRFVAFEGTAGTGDYTTQIHALGDNNYAQVHLATTGMLNGNTLSIEVLTDYAGLLTNIDASSGLIEHSETAEARTLLENMTSQAKVFYTSEMGVSVPEITWSNTAELYPNPSATGAAMLSFSKPLAGNATITVYNERGQLVFTERIAAATSEIQLPAVSAGVHMVAINNETALLSQQRWVVTK